MEPPGACIYKVIVHGGMVTVLFNPSPCPKEITSWMKEDFTLPRTMFCGIEIGSPQGLPQIVLNTLSCPTEPSKKALIRPLLRSVPSAG